MVDEGSYAFLNQWGWYCLKNRKNYYAVRMVTAPKRERVRQKLIRMHNVILNTPLTAICDHWDGDGLNNQIENLRIATYSQNSGNSRKRDNLFKYKGYSYRKNSNKFIAKICVNYKVMHLGLFKTEEEAALAYNKAAKEFRGEYARLNVLDKAISGR